MKYLILIICLVAIEGCSTKPFVTTQTDILLQKSESIYIVNHGWHTGFVVPAKTIQSRLPQLTARFHNTPYLEFGWGDKGFYQAKEITSRLTLQAIFWPTESVIHTVAVSTRPDIYFSESEVEVLCLDHNQYALLISFIENSFYKEESSDIVGLENGIYGNSQFYKGVGSYYLMNTCNKWTAKGLKSAGFDIRPTFKLTASSIMTFFSEENSDFSTGPCSAIRVKDVTTSLKKDNKQ